MIVKIQCGNPDRLFRSNKEFCFPETKYLHPILQIEYVDNLIRHGNHNAIVITTNSDIVIYKLRLLRKEKLIKALSILYYPFSKNENPIWIKVDSNGNCDIEPEGFLDQYSNLLLQFFK